MCRYIRDFHLTGYVPWEWFLRPTVWRVGVEGIYRRVHSGLISIRMVGMQDWIEL